MTNVTTTTTTTTKSYRKAAQPKVFIDQRIKEAISKASLAVHSTLKV